MSFGNDNYGSIPMHKECKPDFESEISALEKRIDSGVELEAAMLDFLNINQTTRLNNISSFAEMLGGVMIIRTEQERQRQHLMERMEKDK